MEFVFFLVGAVAYGSIKLSVLFFYRRIFITGAASKTFDIVSKIFIVASSAWALTFCFLLLFSCGRHIDWLWGVGENCLDTAELTRTLFVSDVIIDTLVICLPIPTVGSVGSKHAESGLLGVIDLTSALDDSAEICSHRCPTSRHYVRCCETRRLVGAFANISKVHRSCDSPSNIPIPAPFRQTNRRLR